MPRMSLNARGQLVAPSSKKGSSQVNDNNICDEIELRRANFGERTMSFR